MEKSNIIISIIIVICIAAGVAAYGITNSENPIFSNLNSVDSGSGDSGNGIGNNTTLNDSPSTDSSGTGNGGTGSGSGSSSSSGSGSGSGSGGGGHSQTTKITQAQAKSIASSVIEQPGWYAGTPKLSGSSWFVPVYNQNNTLVASIEINAYTGRVIGEG